jgi:hypothetical protein
VRKSADCRGNRGRATDKGRRHDQSKPAARLFGSRRDGGLQTLIARYDNGGQLGDRKINSGLDRKSELGNLNKESWFKALCEEQRKQAQTRAKAETVRQASINDSEALSRNLEDIAAGRMVAVSPEEKTSELSPNEIAANDQTSRPQPENHDCVARVLHELLAFS